MPLEMHRSRLAFCVSPQPLIMIGNALLGRYQLRGNPADLEKAASLLGDAFGPRYGDAAKAHIPFLRLFRSLIARFEETRDVLSLAAGIRFGQEALARCPTPYHDRATILGNLSYGLMEKYELGGDRAVLDESVRCGEEALEGLPAGHDGRARLMATLARALHRRGELNADLPSLERASQICEEALTLLPEGDAGRRAALTNLGLCLHRRSQITGDLSLVDESLSVQRKALDAHPIGNPDRGGALCNLGLSLNHRYKQTGDLTSLEDAIGYLREASVICREGHRGIVTANLALSLHHRYEHMGDRAALTDAIDLNRQAAALLPPGNPARCWVSINLVHCLNNLHREDPQPQQAQEAAKAALDALELHPVGHPNRAMALSNHAIALGRLFDHTHDTAHLDGSIKGYEEALLLRPVGHPRRAATLVYLGGSMYQQYNQTLDPKLIEDAISYGNEALNLLPEGHPELCSYRTVLATWYLTRNTRSYNPPVAFKHIAAALSDSSTSARERLRMIAPRVLEYDQDRPRGFVNDNYTRDLLLDIYKQIVRLLPQMAYFGLDLSVRLKELSGSEAFGSAATVYALALSQPELALELLEEARGVFWSQALRLRSPLEGLPTDVRSELSELFHALEGGSARTASSGAAWSDDMLVVRRRQSARAEQLIDEIRTTPGNDRFLLSQPFPVLAAAAAKGPVVVLIAYNSTCEVVAIADSGGTIRRVPLTGLTVTELQKLARQSKFAGMRHVAEDHEEEEVQGRLVKVSKPRQRDEDAKVLENLWNTIVKPIVDALRLEVRAVIPYNTFR